MVEVELLVDGRVLGNSEEGFGVLSFGKITKIDESELVILNLVLKDVASNLIRGRTNSLEDPVNDITFGSATSVFGLNSLTIYGILKICGIIKIFT